MYYPGTTSFYKQTVDSNNEYYYLPESFVDNTQTNIEPKTNPIHKTSPNYHTKDFLADGKPAPCIKQCRLDPGLDKPDDRFINCLANISKCGCSDCDNVSTNTDKKIELFELSDIYNNKYVKKLIGYNNGNSELFGDTGDVQQVYGGSVGLYGREVNNYGGNYIPKFGQYVGKLESFVDSTANTTAVTQPVVIPSSNARAFVNSNPQIDSNNQCLPLYNKCVNNLVNCGKINCDKPNDNSKRYNTMYNDICGEPTSRSGERETLYKNCFDCVTTCNNKKDFDCTKCNIGIKKTCADMDYQQCVSKLINTNQVNNNIERFAQIDNNNYLDNVALISEMGNKNPLRSFADSLSNKRSVNQCVIDPNNGGINNEDFKKCLQNNRNNKTETFVSLNDPNNDIYLNNIRFTKGWTEFANENNSEISNDTSLYKTLMIVGNKSSGGTRNVGMWDNVDVNGDLNVTNKLCVGNTCVDASTWNKIVNIAK